MKKKWKGEEIERDELGRIERKWDEKVHAKYEKANNTKKRIMREYKEQEQQKRRGKEGNGRQTVMTGIVNR